MKRILILLISALLMLSMLASCGNGKTPNNTTATTAPIGDQTPKPDPTVDNTDYRALVRTQFEGLAENAATDFTVEETEGGLAITGYVGSAEKVRIPATINGQAVVRIADGVFEIEAPKEDDPPAEPTPQKTKITVLYIPDCVKSLGKRILAGCDTITAIRTPLMGATGESEQMLGYLFGAESYRDNVFTSLSLKYVWLDGNVTAVMDYAFAECSMLEAVLLDEQVVSIGKFAFAYGGALKYVNLENIQTVGSYAFSACESFVRAEFTGALRSVGLGALQGCAALSSVTVPFVGGSADQNTYFGYLFGAQNSAFTAGFLPLYLRTVTVLDGATALGDYAFFECSPLKVITLPASIASVGVRAFEGCTSLEALTFSDALQSIRENAFVGCTSLGTITLGNSLNSLGVNAFYGCTALKAITLPTSLTTLSASVFADCKALETVNLGGVKQIGKNAFHNCTAIRSATALSNVQIEDGNDPIKKILQPDD